MIFDAAGKVVGQHQMEHRQILPQAGYVEHDAAEIWERTQEVIASALKQLLPAYVPKFQRHHVRHNQPAEVSVDAPSDVVQRLYPRHQRS